MEYRISELESHEDFDDEFHYSSSEKPTRLNLKDYNLNSPLLRDIYEKISLFQSGRINTTNNRKLDEFIQKQDKILFPWSTNHQYIGKLFSTIKQENFSWFNKLIEDAHEDSNGTIELVNCYLRYIKAPIKELHNKKDLPTIVKYWGQIFMECVIITIIMNNEGNNYVEQIKKNLQSRNQRSNRNTIYNFPIIGEIMISPFGIIVENQFFCKNFVLMIKDVMGGRIFSYLSTIDRVDNAYTDFDRRCFIEIWTKGDQVLIQFGNQSYDSFKLIEPVANNRLIINAQKIRPEIDMHSEFEIFVEEEISKSESQGNHFPRFVDHILTVNTNIEFQLGVYGFFRMWGHPYICHEEGLEKLHEQVNQNKIIDDDLAQALGSDLAFKVLEKKFNECRKWFVDIDKMSKDDPLYEYVLTNTWPPGKVIAEYGDKFHLLPLTKCFDIPDFVDPTLIYSDKAHSVTKDELVQDLITNRTGPCKTKRVLDTLIHTDYTYWKNFLQEINDNGLEDKWLLIGLKAKERELKIIGRYFALLSWKLREYFVMTELLIKTNFIKLYDGLTMADDLKGVLSKLINRSAFQGTENYESVTIANHIDYSKWNNHQRKESNKYVFRVMGEFVGYPKLFERTHEFFEKSLIYYAGDRSLLRVNGDQIINSTNIRASWNGQKGGLEGLRQKGWSLLNIILLERIARKRNTRIKLLAQGDNQIVCTSFKLSNTREDKVKMHLDEVVLQNKKIMEDIKDGTQRLGLIINQEETMVSSEFLNYGKVPVYRGNVCGLKMKRWSRVNCFSNDNLPNLSNVLSTVSSTALSVSHFSVSPVDPIYNYNFFGNMMKKLLEIFNPCIGDKIIFKNNRLISNIKALYLDPSIGGVCGMNLNRFLIRTFPDPVTESLSFWKIIYDQTRNPLIKRLAANAGNPNVRFGTKIDFKSLIEDPTSLNLPRGLSPLTMLRNEIRTNMLSNVHTIQNEIIKDITLLGNEEEDQLLDFVMSTRPLFPRFISQLKSSTSCGIRDSIVGMYENSKTIRRFFLESLRDDFDEKVIKSELLAISKLDELQELDYMGWCCSSTKADQLRRLSWGTEIVGMTVPHPIELFAVPELKTNCVCNDNGNDIYLTSIVNGIKGHICNERGHLTPYLGSSTSEGTSIISPWEKESKIPFIKRILKIRNAINWFVEPESNLGKSIVNLIEAVTEIEIKLTDKNRRTGSAIHRFSSERQSSGGYSAVSPAFLTRVFTTTDTLGVINTKNYDFMYQSSIIMMQSLLSRPSGYHFEERRTYHSHIKCQECLREIDEITIESGFVYKPRSIHSLISKWIPDLENSWEIKEMRVYPHIKSDEIAYSLLNFQVGVTTGFAFSEMSVKGDESEGFNRLFPNSISSKIIPHEYLNGIVQGIINCASLNCLSRKSLNTLKDPYTAIGGNVITSINRLTNNSQFLSLCKGDNLNYFFLDQPHKVPSSYPLNVHDQVLIIKSVLREMTTERLLERRKRNETVMMFPDIIDTPLETALLLGAESYNILISNVKKRVKIEKLRLIKQQNINFRIHEPVHLPNLSVQPLFINQEIRHVLKFHQLGHQPVLKEITFNDECVGHVNAFEITFRYQREGKISIEVPQISNPLISGLRLFQMATGAHYKLRSIIKHFNIKYKRFLCGGDGSGGITSLLLRMDQSSYGVFNSLLTLEDCSLRGSKPSPPSAVMALGNASQRCLNLTTCWEHPSDLRNQATWEYFKSYSKKNKFDLAIFDMESTSDDDFNQIIGNLDYYMPELISKNGSIIFKTYLKYIIDELTNPLKIISSWFEMTFVCQTEFTSSNSSEVYIVGKKLSRVKITKIIDADCLKNIIKNNYVFSTFEQEFERAKQVRKKDLLRGIHYTLRTPLRTEIEILLNSGGVPNGISHRLSLQLSRSTISTVEIKWELIKIIDHFAFETGKQITTPNIPSDQTLQTVISIYIGILFSLSLDHNHDRQHVFTKMIEKGLRIQITLKKINDFYIPSWDIGSTGKFVPLHSKMALIGSAIRTCERLSDRLQTDQYRSNKSWITENLLLTGIPKLWSLESWDLNHYDIILSNPGDNEIDIQMMSYDL
ncbi:polymerase [Ouango virus]|uniref:Replicase n=2 Tax=Ouango virus TaxID=864692 RepID=A0AAE8XBN1_9RHAB|nr:polymerase [Ouango virus]UAU42893.1 polymerase [Ouango virus]